MRHRGVEPAERVDEAALARLLAGPDASLRHGVDLLRRGLARLGRLLDEVVVEALHDLLQLLALRRRERRERRVDVGVRARHDRLAVDADLVQRAADGDLAAEDADRSGQRPRLRDDRLRRHGDVVAARRGEIRHRHDERPVVGFFRA